MTLDFIRFHLIKGLVTMIFQDSSKGFGIRFGVTLVREGNRRWEPNLCDHQFVPMTSIQCAKNSLN